MTDLLPTKFQHTKKTLRKHAAKRLFVYEFQPIVFSNENYIGL